MKLMGKLRGRKKVSSRAIARKGLMTFQMPLEPTAREGSTAGRREHSQRREHSREEVFLLEALQLGS